MAKLGWHWALATAVAESDMERSEFYSEQLHAEDTEALFLEVRLAMKAIEDMRQARAREEIDAVLKHGARCDLKALRSAIKAGAKAKLSEQKLEPVRKAVTRWSGRPRLTRPWRRCSQKEWSWTLRSAKERCWKVKRRVWITRSWKV